MSVTGKFCLVYQPNIKTLSNFFMINLISVSDDMSIWKWNVEGEPVSNYGGKKPQTYLVVIYS